MARNTKKKKEQHRKTISRSKEPLFRREWLLFLIIFLAAALRLIDLGRQGLWVDEICVYRDSLSTYRRIFHTVHPVTFLLARTALYIHDNEFFLRLPSAICGVLSILIIFIAGKSLFNRTTGLLAAILLTFSPYHIYYSQDANYYAEMMFFSLLTYWLLIQLVLTKKLYYFPLTLISMFIAYKTHLFSLFVVGATALSLGLWLLTDKDFHRSIMNTLRRIHRKNRFIIPIAIIVILIVMIPLLIYFIKIALKYSFHYPTEGFRAENFELSVGFFWRLATDYGIAFQQYILRNSILTALLVLLFIIGLVQSCRRQWIIFSYFLLLLVVPFIFLTIQKVQHFYHPRYTSFILPVYILCIAHGIFFAANVLVKVLKSTKNNIQAICIYGITASILLFMMPNLVRYYTGHKQNWKYAAQYLKENLKQNDIVAVYQYWNRECLEFYLERHDMDLSSIIKIPEIRGAGETASLNFLKKVCFDAKGDVYLISSYTRYEPPEVFDWVKQFFTTAAYFPSLHPHEINREGKEVVVYKWQYSQSYVYPPMIYSQSLSVQPTSAPSLFSRSILFDKSGEYTFRISTNTSLSSFPVLRIQIDKDPQISFVVSSSNKSAKATIPLSHGLHHIRISAKADTEELRTSLSSLNSLEIYMSPQGFIHREAEEADIVHPTTNKWVRTEYGALCFTLKINAYLGYEHIFSEDDEDFYFKLKALNDKPGPVLIEVAIDGKIVGILSFDKNDNSWGFQGFPVHLKAGQHTIRLQFLNHYPYGGSQNPDEDNDALLDYFELIALAKLGTEPADDRIPLSMDDLAPIPDSLCTFSIDKESGQLSPWWLLALNDMEFSLVPAHISSTPYYARFTVPPRSTGASLISVPFPVAPGKHLYLSSEMRCENLSNHSANMVIFFLNARKEEIYRLFWSDEGITADQPDWVRFVFFGAVPDAARAAYIQFSIYPNSNMDAKDIGTVWFSNLRKESL